LYSDQGGEEGGRGELLTKLQSEKADERKGLNPTHAKRKKAV